jgi:hypothetical protein
MKHYFVHVVREGRTLFVADCGLVPEHEAAEIFDGLGRYYMGKGYAVTLVAQETTQVLPLAGAGKLREGRKDPFAEQVEGYDFYAVVNTPLVKTASSADGDRSILAQRLEGGAWTVTGLFKGRQAIAMTKDLLQDAVGLVLTCCQRREW